MSTSCKFHLLVLAACAIHVPSLQLSSLVPPTPEGAVLAQQDLAHHTSSREKKLSQALHKLTQGVNKTGTNVQAATPSAAVEEKLKKDLKPVKASHVQAKVRATQKVQRQAALGHQSIAMDLKHQVEKTKQRHREQERYLEAQSQALHEMLAHRTSQSAKVWPETALGPEAPKDSLTPGTNDVLDTVHDTASGPPTIDAWSAEPSTRQDFRVGHGAQGLESQAPDGNVPSSQPMGGTAEAEVKIDSAEPATGKGVFPGMEEQGPAPPPSAVDEFFGPPEAAQSTARVQQDYNRNQPEQMEEHSAQTKDDMETQSQARVKQDYFRNRPEQDTVANPGAVIGALPDTSRDPVQGEQGQEVPTRHSFDDFSDGSQAKRVPAVDKMRQATRMPDASSSPTVDDLDVAGNINPVVSSIMDGSPPVSNTETVPGMTIAPAVARREAFPGANAQDSENLEEAAPIASNTPVDYTSEAMPAIPNEEAHEVPMAVPSVADIPSTGRREARPATAAQETWNMEEAAPTASTIPLEEASRAAPVAARLPADEMREATASIPGIPAAAESEAFPGTIAQESESLEPAAPDVSGVPLDEASQAVPAAATKRETFTDEMRQSFPTATGLPVEERRGAPAAASGQPSENLEAAPTASQEVPSATSVPGAEAQQSVPTVTNRPSERRKAPRFTFEDFDDNAPTSQESGTNPLPPSVVQQEEQPMTMPGNGPSAWPTDPFRMPSEAAKPDQPYPAVPQPQFRPTQSLDDYLAGTSEPGAANDQDMRMPGEAAPTSPAASATEAPMPAVQPGLAGPTQQPPTMGQEGAPMPGARDDIAMPSQPAAQGAPAGDQAWDSWPGGQPGRAAPTQPPTGTGQAEEGASTWSSDTMSGPATQERQVEAPASTSPPGGADSSGDVAANETNEDDEARAHFGPAQEEAVKWAKEEVDRLLRDRMDDVRTEAKEWAKSEVDGLDKELTARWAKEEADVWKAVEETAKHAVDGVANRWAIEAADRRRNASAQDPSDVRQEAAAAAEQEATRELQQREEQWAKTEQEILNHTAEVAKKVAGYEARKSLEEMAEKQQQEAEAAAANRDGFMAQAATNCAAWPADASYGCSNKQRNWFKLSNYTSDDECRSLCGAKVNEVGRLCCYVGHSFGCWMKPSSRAVKFDNGPGRGVTCAPNPASSSSPAASSRRLAADRPRPPAP